MIARSIFGFLPFEIKLVSSNTKLVFSYHLFLTQNFTSPESPPVCARTACVFDVAASPIREFGFGLVVVWNAASAEAINPLGLDAMSVVVNNALPR